MDYLKLVEEHGSINKAAEATGVPRATFQRRVKDQRERDPAITAGMSAVGTQMTPRLMWAKVDGYSVMLKPEDPQFPTFLDQIRETIADLKGDMPTTLPRRFAEREGQLLVLDPADVHIGKLCVETETGVRYDAKIAEHRLVEGSRMLVERAMRAGATRVLLVIGNDIAHIDSPKRTTTSGTPQDTDGSIFSIFRAAQAGYVRVVNMILEAGLGVRIMFNPSNHDWVLGFTIAQFVQAWFREHPNVEISDYGVSERHRKYLRFGSNLIGLTHGDGVKEADLSQVMLREARPHVADAPHLYWYVHHYHHKIRKGLGVRSRAREKDHIAMTVINSAAGEMEGDNCQVEYVRSPSAPDGWHDRNGYIGRQAVEAFLHCPRDGQCDRFTEWF